jgi:hypothetical protein
VPLSVRLAVAQLHGACRAAQKRAAQQSVMPSGPRRLGGDAARTATMTPREAAAAAAERRARDNRWCPTAAVATGDAVIDLVSDDEDADVNVTPSQQGQQAQQAKASDAAADAGPAHANHVPVFISPARSLTAGTSDSAVLAGASGGAQAKRQRVRQGCGGNSANGRDAPPSPRRAAAAAALLRAHRSAHVGPMPDGPDVAASWTHGRQACAPGNMCRTVRQHGPDAAAAGARPGLGSALAPAGLGISLQHTAHVAAPCAACAVDLTESPMLDAAGTCTGSHGHPESTSQEDPPGHAAVAHAGAAGVRSGTMRRAFGADEAHASRADHSADKGQAIDAGPYRHGAGIIEVTELD